MLNIQPLILTFLLLSRLDPQVQYNGLVEHALQLLD